MKIKFTALFAVLAVLGVLGVLTGSVWTFEKDILLGLRLPRVVLAFIIGGTLGMCGSVYQGVLRNQLADPYILGSASGAALGVVFSDLLGLKGATAFFAFFGSLAAVFLVLYLSSNAGAGWSKNLIILGVSANIFISSAIILVYFALSKDMHQLFLFIFGNLHENDFSVVVASAAFIGISLIFFYAISNMLNILTLGDDKSRSLGIELKKWRFIIIAALSAAVGVSVALAGIIGFVGLIAPHISRSLFGPDHRKNLPAAFMIGAAFLLLGDILSRVAFPPIELPVGVVTSLIGVPYFIYMLARYD